MAVIENGKFRVLLTVVLWLSPIIIGFALALGAYREKQSALIIKTDATNIRVSANENMTMTNYTAIAVILKDVSNIKESLIRIEKKLEE